jgi:hypothetical protein
MNPRNAPASIVLGPRTTVFTLLVAYPFLERFLLGYSDAFVRLGTAA